MIEVEIKICKTKFAIYFLLFFFRIRFLFSASSVCQCRHRFRFRNCSDYYRTKFAHNRLVNFRYLPHFGAKSVNISVSQETLSVSVINQIVNFISCNGNIKCRDTQKKYHRKHFHAKFYTRKKQNLKKCNFLGHKR